MTRFRKENAVSSCIPPHGCITSCEKSGDVAEESKGKRSPQQNIILSERTETINAKFEMYIKLSLAFTKSTTVLRV